jgi:flagellar biosynthesis protein FlhG
MNKAKILTVSSGKGGVGKTFFSVNLSASLVMAGYKVLLFDADVNFSNANLYLHVDGSNSYAKYLKGEVEFRELIQKGVGGVDLFFLGDEYKRSKEISDDENSQFHRDLKKLQQNYDFIIFDMPAGINDFIIDWLKYADENLIVVNSDSASVVDAYRFIKLSVSEKRSLKFHVISNKVNSPEEGRRTFTALQSTIQKFKVRTHLNYAGFIFQDPERVFLSVQQRIPMVLLQKQAPISQSIFSIAQNISRIKKPMERGTDYNMIYGAQG